VSQPLLEKHCEHCTTSKKYTQVCLIIPGPGYIWIHWFIYSEGAY